MDKYIRIEDKILDMYNTNKCIYVIRNKSVSENECRYVSYHWDNWKEYYLIDYQNCVLFSYNSAQSFINDLMKENLNYQDLVIELSPYYKDCRQADTINELCDEYIWDKSIIRFIDKTHFSYEHDDFIFNLDESKLKDGIYGAIWVLDDNGAPILKSVSKMKNMEGDLELI